MKRIDYALYLAALKRWFHGGQVPGEYYKPSGIFHSLGARGYPHDANGNRLDLRGRVIGRDQAFYGTINPINQFTGRPHGHWMRPSGDDWMRRR